MERIKESEILDEIIEAIGLRRPPEGSFTITDLLVRLQAEGEKVPCRRTLSNKLNALVEKGELRKQSYSAGGVHPDCYYWKP